MFGCIGQDAKLGLMSGSNRRRREESESYRRIGHGDVCDYILSNEIISFLFEHPSVTRRLSEKATLVCCHIRPGPPK